ncbi:hypothetical protein TIFTF001_035436 [Ficus carica]|uniref:Uncharacterized protein n=1 Tax=Ficus carica TaxID=3494 RepID=A0AA88JA53_FICCA|nr:hypothetical protein TIFTF001_035436 [Ficus carica]
MNTSVYFLSIAGKSKQFHALTGEDTNPITADTRGVFVLDCKSDPDSPVLDAVPQKFRVIDINQKARVLTIARIDFRGQIVNEYL